MIASALEHPNEVAERLIGRNYISWSSISSYQTCPLRFYFRYVEQLPEKLVSSALVFGGAIHSAIELHYQRLLTGDDPPEVAELLQAYRSAWKDRDLGAIRFGKDETVKTLETLAERMLTAFRGSEIATPTGRIIGIEEQLTGEVVPGCPDLLARIDLIEETDEALVITDFKTARSRWNASKVEDSADQLLLYHEVGQKLGDKPIRLQFSVITKAKAPAVDQHSVQVNRAKTNRVKRVVREVWNAIEAGHFYPNPSAMNCPGCAFRDACTAWGT